MVAKVIGCERLGDHGELRSFLRDGPPVHLAFEIFQDADGRAWTLRVPQAKAVSFQRLVRIAQSKLERPETLQMAADGTCLLGREDLAEGDDITAIILDQGGDQVFALWRRELLRSGWSWTLDAVFVPLPLGRHLCLLIDDALQRAPRQ
jgi:hypothetical protein